MSLRWWSSCRTDTGKRRQVNEDAFLERPDLGLWLVADGMGGHDSGDVASRMVVSALNGLQPPLSMDEFGYAVKQRLYEADRRVQEEAARGGANRTMGSTVVVFLAFQNRGLCLWAGDSRAYLLRGGGLSQISRDHSVVEDMIERGELRREDADSHPAANLITRAIGAQENLVIDERPQDLRDGDTVLLCSDGLNKEVTDEEIADVLSRHDCEAASRALIELTLERGARDNVTVAVVRFQAASPGASREPGSDTIWR